MKELERDLGLLSVLAISIGAMIGSGVFILPALALEIAGPAVILAYALAGVLVVPAALSKSEMATAMPEAGEHTFILSEGWVHCLVPSPVSVPGFRSRSRGHSPLSVVFHTYS
jgi:Amino acid transporters